MYDRVKQLWAERGKEVFGGQCGFSILNGPAQYRPQLMILGANGGFGHKDDKPHFEASPPLVSSSGNTDWPLASRLRAMFDGWGLGQILNSSIQSNFLFFSSSAVSRAADSRGYRWQDLPEKLRTELEGFCLREIKGYVEVSEPKCLLVLGTQTFDRHADNVSTVIMDKSKRRRLLLQGRVFGRPALAILHPTGARVANEDWREVGPQLRQAITGN
jgi:hypothetical protein